jgi:hypothetical protein
VSNSIRKVIEELRQRRDNLDAAIRILEEEVCPEEAGRSEGKRRGRPPKKSGAALDN